MSEEKPIYVTNRDEEIINKLRKQGSLNTFQDGFMQPTPSQVKELRVHLGLTQVECAKLLGVAFNEQKGSNTVRKWETNPGDKESRKIPYSAWRLMLILKGVVSLPEIEKNY